MDAVVQNQTRSDLGARTKAFALEVVDECVYWLELLPRSNLAPRNCSPLAPGGMEPGLRFGPGRPKGWRSPHGGLAAGWAGSIAYIGESQSATRISSARQGVQARISIRGHLHPAPTYHHSGIPSTGLSCCPNPEPHPTWLATEPEQAPRSWRYPTFTSYTFNTSSP